MLPKHWPYLLGLAMLLAAAVAGPRLLKPQARPEQPAQGSVQGAAAIHELKPILAQKAPEALYFLLAEALVVKLKPSDMTLTIHEFRDLTRKTAQHLRDDLGLEMPTGFTLPPAVPAAWLDKPVFESMDHYNYINQVHTSNQGYLHDLVNRLLDEYGPKTVPMLMERFVEARALRKPGDQVSLSFIKALYGDNFVNDYANARYPAESVKPKPRAVLKGETLKVTVPPKLVAEAESEAAALWRTEFNDDGLAAVRDFILNQRLGDKLREDLLYNDMTAAEKGLIEKNIVGYRLLYLHGLTRQVVSARCKTRPSLK